MKNFIQFINENLSNIDKVLDKMNDKGFWESYRQRKRTS